MNFSLFFLVLVSGRSRTRLLSRRTKMVRAALGPVRKRTGMFRAGRSQSSTVRDLLDSKGPGRPETNTSFSVYSTGISRARKRRKKIQKNEIYATYPGHKCEI